MFAFTGAVSPFVTAYDEILNGPFRQFQAASEKIGGDVKAMVNIIGRSLESYYMKLIQ